MIATPGGGGSADNADRFVSVAPKIGYQGPLDGLRAIAVLMVLFTHAAYSSFASFAGSVDVFFVVSGFLITTLILEEDRARGHVDVKTFYLRRVLRLFPVLYAVLGATLVAGLFIGNNEFRDRTINDVLSAGLYVYHVIHPVGIEIGAKHLPEVRPLIHLWSLSVEEHFYLVALILMMTVVRFRLARQLIVVFSALWLAIGIARLTGHVGWKYMWYQRPDALMIGVVAAAANSLIPTISESTQRLLRRIATVALAGAVVVLLLGTKLVPSGWFIPFAPERSTDPNLADKMWWARFGFSVTSGVTAFLVFTLVRSGNWWLSRLFSNKVLCAIGRRSYCIYLVHVPLAVMMVEAAKGHITEEHVLLAYLFVLPVVSELVFRFVEKPGLRLKRKFVRLTPAGATPAPPPPADAPLY